MASGSMTRGNAQAPGRAVLITPAESNVISVVIVEAASRAVVVDVRSSTGLSPPPGEECARRDLNPHVLADTGT